MVEYTQPYTSLITVNEVRVYSFLQEGESNLDSKTVHSFGEEWKRFYQFNTEEIELIGNDYFDLATMITSDMVALDVGCGNGRWAQYLSSKLNFIEAIDPSESVKVAAIRLNKFENIRVSQANVDNIPFQDNTFDFVYSLGVLHHVPDTQGAIQQCFNKTKSDGWFLLYLYYNLENRGRIFRILFKLTDFARIMISSSPSWLKFIICDLIALIVYWPLARLSFVVALFSWSLAKQIPLSYYRKTSFFIMRNDALDRFGTPLEKRFSRVEIAKMLEQAGFINIHFSSHEPYWHVVAQKP